ncbi:hypothetical protein EVAR_80369_1 [Eumeta japonica]|uniref:DUF4794 domain-containing protein n=1 Tax=Eumeta variegata TaxID=151549 RepID=A0A4C1X2V5_EUMVA|nr:hypothetical protein EVAR_80369_1 [Eumeta japonica]
MIIISHKQISAVFNRSVGADRASEPRGMVSRRAAPLRLARKHRLSRRAGQRSERRERVLAVSFFLVSAALCEPPAPAPYAPSGWRPNGPTFDLPQKTAQAANVQDTYLPPQQAQNPPASEYGPPEEDVSVQALPTSEQTPQFLVSPISGQQYVGPTFNADVRSLDQSYRQSQIQQDTFKELQKQRELQEQNRNINGFPITQPRQYAKPDVQSTEKTLTTSSPSESTTKSDIDYADDNPEESVASKVTSKSGQNPQERTTVEVAKQNVQQIPPELLLSPLSQLAANQYAYPLQQLGQLRAPIFYQPNVYSQPLIQPVGQYQGSDFDGPAHFAALQSILSQRQILLGQPQSVYQTQQGFLNGQPNVFVRREQPQSDPDAVSIDQFNPQFPNSRLQSNTQQNQPLPQSQDDNTETKQRNNKSDDDDETIENQNQPKFIVNQPQFYQPQEIPYQYQQPLEQQSNQFVPQQQFLYNQPQHVMRILGQDALQSGLDINQQGNDVGSDSKKKDEDDDNMEENDDDGSTATAVATAFGSRLSPPRTFTQYGAPVPNIRPRTRQNDSPTEDSNAIEVAMLQRHLVRNYSKVDSTKPHQWLNTYMCQFSWLSVSDAGRGPAIAEATAVADGPKKSARLRNRRVRPIFTLDRSGHLVLASSQQAE